MHISLCDNKVRSLNNFFDCIVQCTPKKWTTFEEGISNVPEAAKLLLCIPKELIPQVSQLRKGKTVIPLCTYYRPSAKMVRISQMYTEE